MNGRYAKDSAEARPNAIGSLSGSPWWRTIDAMTPDSQCDACACSKDLRVNLLQPFSGDSQRLRIPLFYSFGKTQKHLRAEMPADAPAPKAGRLGKQREVHARRIHMVFERRGRPGERSGTRFGGAALEILDGLARDDLPPPPAARGEEPHPAVVADRVHRLALAGECRVAFLRHVALKHARQSCRGNRSRSGRSPARSRAGAVRRAPCRYARARRA